MRQDRKIKYFRGNLDERKHSWKIRETCFLFCAFYFLWEICCSFIHVKAKSNKWHAKKMLLSVSSLWQRSDKPLSSLLLKISVPLTDLPQFPWLLHPFLVTLNILILRTHLIFLHLWCIFSSGDGGGKILSLS